MAEKKYKPFYADVILGARCARCGKDFTKRHPKDDETLCEECRKARNSGHDLRRQEEI